MKVGKPRRRRRRRKPRPKPEADKEKVNSTPAQPLADPMSKEETNIGIISNGGGDKNENSGQVFPPAPPPGGIVREPLILGENMVNMGTT